MPFLLMYTVLLDFVEHHDLEAGFIEHPDEIQGIYRTVWEEEGTHAAVRDWISGMTDRYALEMYGKLFVPQGWRQL